MSELIIPYDELSLRMGLIEFFGLDGSKEKEVEEMMVKINERLNADPKLKALNGDKKDLNKFIAEENGISVIDLINSPNYKLLIDEFRFSAIKGFVESCKAEGMSDRSAWAIVAMGLGLIEG